MLLIAVVICPCITPIVVELLSVVLLLLSDWVFKLLKATSKVWFWLFNFILVAFNVLVLVSLLNPLENEL